VKVEEDEVRIMLLRRGDRTVRIFGDCDYPIAGIVFDEIFDSFCEP
jgi:hypothetical protein